MNEYLNWNGEINPIDFTIDVIPGDGQKEPQSLNKIRSGIRITHNPTGLVVEVTNSRNPIENKIKAWCIMGTNLQDYKNKQFAPQATADAQDADGHILNTLAISAPIYKQIPLTIVPEGWKLVPLKPTDEMQKACKSVVDLEQGDPEDHRYDDGITTVNEIYSAMLSATPALPSTEDSSAGDLAEVQAEPVAWLPVAGFEDAYEVSSSGDIRNAVTGNILAKNLMGSGYVKANLWSEGKRKQTSVHRVVAQAFIPNPNDLAEVNHIDGDKTNNTIENLEWSDRQSNNNHALYGLGKRTKPVIAVDPESGEETYFPSINAAGRCGYNASGIYNVLNGLMHTHKGKHWAYTEWRTPGGTAPQAQPMAGNNAAWAEGFSAGESWRQDVVTFWETNDYGKSPAQPVNPYPAIAPQAQPADALDAERIDNLYIALEVCAAELFAQCGHQGRAMKYVEQARKALATEQCARAAMAAAQAKGED